MHEDTIDNEFNKIQQTFEENGTHTRFNDREEPQAKEGKNSYSAEDIHEY